MNHLKQIAARLDEYGIDAMLVSSEPGERYAVGFGGRGAMWWWRRTSADTSPIPGTSRPPKSRSPGPPVTMTDRAKNYRILIQKAVDDLGIEKLGFEDGYMTVAQYRQLADAFTCELVPPRACWAPSRAARMRRRLPI